MDSAEPKSYYSQLLRTQTLPPPGPEHFAVRRSLWLTPPPASENRRSERDPVVFERLENALSRPEEFLSDSAWKQWLERIYSQLVGGQQLKVYLNLRLVVRIVYAGWVQNGLWPKGATAPDTDNFSDDATGYEPPPHPPSTPNASR